MEVEPRMRAEIIILYMESDHRKITRGQAASPSQVAATHENQLYLSAMCIKYRFFWFDLASDTLWMVRYMSDLRKAQSSVLIPPCWVLEQMCARVYAISGLSQASWCAWQDLQATKAPHIFQAAAGHCIFGWMHTNRPPKGDRSEGFYFKNTDFH